MKTVRGLVVLCAAVAMASALSCGGSGGSSGGGSGSAGGGKASGGGSGSSGGGSASSGGGSASSGGGSAASGGGSASSGGGTASSGGGTASSGGGTASSGGGSASGGGSGASSCAATYASSSCDSPTDLTGGGSSVMFDFSTTFGAPVCIKVKTSQSVTVTGVSGVHPIAQDCGPTSVVAGVGETMGFTHTFSTAGTWGFHCTVHGAASGASMSLAIKSVP
ncbi:MAG: hypothetical protein K1X89_17970 [Myxococcaceae bacterium]|nr:hypothetical protein [Myxococcaceae bacterium]